MMEIFEKVAQNPIRARNVEDLHQGTKVIFEKKSRKKPQNRKTRIRSNNNYKRDREDVRITRDWIRRSRR